MKTGIITASLLILAAAAAQAGVLAPGLADQMDGLAGDEILKVLVVMKDPTDLARMDKNLHEALARRADRNRTVVTTLREAAAAAQGGLLADLESRRGTKSTGGVLGYTPHWIIDAVVVVADVATIREIAARDDVDVVEPDLRAELIEPVMTKPALLPHDKAEGGGFVAPGVQAVNAPRVWHELGLTGEGSIVGNCDSGVDGSHPMLADRWRGNFAPVDQAWRDLGGVNSPDFPYDDYGHGTHVMGTITGATATDTVGVAPGAEWIATNAVWATLNEFDNAIISAFEFFADPDGDPQTSDEVPDVVQNSWGVGVSAERGYVECDSRWWEVIDNCEAAGVVVLWSAGNEGPYPMSLRSPGNRASSPTNAFTVGSVSDAPPYYVSSFSSRGPSQCGGPYEIKPEVVAPGENVISCYPNNQYAYMDGTSMAGPHVAGIVALMRQANPDLDVVSIKEILMETAIDVGSQGEDNASGWGMVDAYAAVLAAMGSVGQVEGVVTDADTGLPVPGALVERVGKGYHFTTDQDGRYEFVTRAGPVSLAISAFGYYDGTAAGQLAADETLLLETALTPLPKAVVSGTVFGPDDQPVSGATVRAAGVAFPPAVTDAEGRYTLLLPLVEDAHFTLTATALDLAFEVEFIGLEGDRTVDFHLPYINAEGFETGTLTSFPWFSAGDVPMTPDTAEAFEGLYSLRSGDIRDDETSEISLTYYVTWEGEISFQVRTSSEKGYDGLIFLVDDVYVRSWSGETPWTRFATTVPAGSHRFTWRYIKDYAVSAGSDAAWIDRIEFPGTGVQPQPKLRLDRSAVALALNPGLLQDETLVLANDGGYRLDFTATLVPGSGTPEGWVTLAPAPGWVHPGVTRSLDLAFDAAGLDYGTYEALLEIETNDPDAPATTVPLTLTVGHISAVDDLPAAGIVEFPGAVPNPFNPMTQIAYTLGADAEVSLRIYDVSGRLVRDLVAGTRAAGPHRERWDGRDGSGRGVASGVYFARLKVGTETQLRQMLLVR